MDYQSKVKAWRRGFTKQRQAVSILLPFEFGRPDVSVGTKYYFALTKCVHCVEAKTLSQMERPVYTSVT